MTKSAKELAFAICNVAELTGYTTLASFPFHLLGPDYETQRYDEMRVSHNALTAYRLCRKALNDLSLGGELPNDPQTKTSAPTKVASILQCCAEWREIINVEREKAKSATFDNIDSASIAAAAFKLELAEQVLQSNYVRIEMPTPAKVAELYAQLTNKQASFVRAFQAAAQHPAAQTASVLLSGAAYFFEEYAGSRRAIEKEFAQYTKKITEKLQNTPKEPDFSDLFAAAAEELYRVLGAALMGVEQGRTSTIASYFELAVVEFSTAEKLLAEAEKAMAAVTQPAEIPATQEAESTAAEADDSDEDDGTILEQLN